MAVYNTKGKRAVIEILQNNPERQLSVEDIFVSLGENAPGQSSIYRILSSLQKSGEIRREKNESGDGYLYQYAENLGCNDHFHLKCGICGKVTHLRCRFGDELISHILSDHGFVIDSGRTVFYGKCAECSGGTLE